MAHDWYRWLSAASRASRGLKASSCSGIGLVEGVFESAEAVMADAEFGRGPDDVLREGSLGIGDIGGDHGDFQAMPPDGGDQPRKLLPDALRLDVAALANRKIEAVEADFRGAFGEFVALQEVQVLGENRDLQLLFGGSRPACQKRRAAGEEGPSGKLHDFNDISYSQGGVPT